MFLRGHSINCRLGWLRTPICLVCLECSSFLSLYDPMQDSRRASSIARWRAIVPLVGLLCFVAWGTLQWAGWVPSQIDVAARTAIWCTILAWVVWYTKGHVRRWTIPHVVIGALLAFAACVDCVAGSHTSGVQLGLASCCIALGIVAVHVWSKPQPGLAADTPDDTVAVTANRITHQLNNALMPVVAQTQLLQLTDMTAEEEEQAQQLILNGAERAADLVKRLQQLYDPQVGDTRNPTIASSA